LGLFAIDPLNIKEARYDHISQLEEKLIIDNIQNKTTANKVLPKAGLMRYYQAVEQIKNYNSTKL
jgi:hypothetical protein